MRHEDWCRIRVTPTSDLEAAGSLVSLGRKLLGQMMSGLALVGQRTGVLRRRLPDGSTIVVRFDGTTPMIDIDVPGDESAALAGEVFNMWVPRGFVVYPAWYEEPFGVGLPIVQDATLAQVATSIKSIVRS